MKISFWHAFECHTKAFPFQSYFFSFFAFDRFLMQPRKEYMLIFVFCLRVQFTPKSRQGLVMLCVLVGRTNTTRENIMKIYIL